MIIEYSIDWSRYASSGRHPQRPSDLTDVMNVEGQLTVITAEKTFAFQSPHILIDLSQIINSMSKIAHEEFSGNALPVSLAEVPSYYTYYGKTIDIYEFKPSHDSIVYNPIIERLSRKKAAALSDNLRDRVSRDMSEHCIDLLSFYKTLLF